MNRARLVGVLLAIGAATLLVWGFTRKSSAPEIPFAKATRSTVVSALSTNGKVEPIEWASARAERAGVVERVLVQKGQEVHAGEALVSLDATGAESQLATAEAAMASARAQQQVLKQGGPQIERAQIEGSLATARTNLQNAAREHDSLQRLVDKQAATRIELEAARQRMEAAQLQIDALQRRRKALVAATDVPVAQSRANEAEAASTLAKRMLGQSMVRAPISGVVYQFDLKVGSFLNPGDLVANVGRLDQVRVKVYVDEPDLGRVERGMTVTISWTALPGRLWKGAVDKLPTEVVALGTRQVGEVSCVIDNPDHDLLPGTNIDAEIQSRIIHNGLTIPKEALRREGDVTGVYVLNEDDKVIWRPVKVGVSSYTKAQILSGLKDGDSIALPSDKPLKNGLRVSPHYQ